MDSNLLTLVVFCGIAYVIAEAQTDFDTNIIFNITGKRELLRFKGVDLDSAETKVLQNGAIEMRHYLTLVSTDYSEQLEVQNQIRQRGSRINLADTFVHLGDSDFLLTNLTWGTDSVHAPLDSMISFQPCLLDAGKSPMSLDNQMIIFNISFAPNLCVLGEAEKIEIPVFGNPENTLETQTSVPVKYDQSIAVSPIPPTSLPENSPVHVRTAVTVRQNPLLVVTHKPTPREPASMKTRQALIVSVENAQAYVVYERKATNTRGIITVFKKEYVKFEKLSVDSTVLNVGPLLKDDREMKNDEDDMTLMQKLADSWMENLMNTIYNQFLKPKMREVTRLQFLRRKEHLAKQISSTILSSLTNNPTLFQGERFETEDRLLNKYPVDYIELKNFQKFSELIFFSGIRLSKNNGHCASSNVLHSHSLDFDFRVKAAVKSNLPSVFWHRIPVEQHENSSIFQRPESYEHSNFTLTDFSVQFIIKTDSFGNAISTVVETYLPMDAQIEVNRKKFYPYFAAIRRATEVLISERVEERIKKSSEF